MYSDYNELFEELSDKDAGKLIKHIFKYVNDENPESKDPIVKISFIPIKQQLKRDLAKYEDKKKQWSDAGKASAEARKLKKDERNQRTSTTVKNVATDLTVNDNVTVNVNGTDNVNATVIKKGKHSFSQSQFFEIHLFILEISKDQKYHCFDLDHYHESLELYSNQGHKYKDWISAAKSWMRRDVQNDKAVISTEFQTLKNDKWDEWARSL